MSVVKFPKVFSQEEITRIASSVFAGSIMHEHWTFLQHGRERPSPSEAMHLYLDFKFFDDHVIRVHLTDDEVAHALLVT